MINKELFAYIKIGMIHQSFICYVWLYNFIGRCKDRICFFLNIKPIPLPAFLWVDFRCWHALPEHPCHKARKYVRDIYLATGLLPFKEYLYLFDEES